MTTTAHARSGPVSLSGSGGRACWSVSVVLTPGVDAAVSFLRRGVDAHLLRAPAAH